MKSDDKDSTCLTAKGLDNCIHENKWRISQVYEGSGEYLFKSYVFEQGAKCMSYRNFIYLLVDEVMNNKKLTSECDNCMKDIKSELKKFYNYIETNGSG